MPAINKIILGTVQLGIPYGINNKAGMLAVEDAIELLYTAYDEGLRILDTAEAYGKAQEIIGIYHKRFPNKRFNVITKYSSHFQAGQVSPNIADNIYRDIEELNIESLWGYMFHNYSDYKSNRNNLNSLTNLKHTGTIKKIGVSLYTNEELEDIIKDEQIDFIQLPFNLLDNFNHRGYLIQKAKNKGKEIHIRSVFLQGLFFKSSDDLPDKLIPLRPYLSCIEKLATVNELGINHLALAYAVQQKSIDKVLIGVDTTKHLKENISLLHHTISDEIIQAVNKLKVEEIELLNPVNWN